MSSLGQRRQAAVGAPDTFQLEPTTQKLAVVAAPEAPTVIDSPGPAEHLPSPLPAEELARAAHTLRLSLIVPATDNPKTLAACLEAIRSSFDPPTEIIVIDSASPAGASVARNKGAALATGDILVFVDADIVVHPDAISRLHSHLEAHPGTAAVFGSYDDAPKGKGLVSGFRNLLHHHVHQASGGPVGTFWAGLGAIRREDFESVGGFDPERLWLEDIDLGIRLNAAGKEVVLEPSIQGTHLKRWSLREMIRTDFHRRAVPWMDLIIRHGHASTDLNLSWRHRASASMVLVATIASLAWSPIAAAGAAVLFVALNLPFYRILRRRQGSFAALCGVFLHAIHHAVSIAAVPYAIVRHLSRRAAARSGQRDHSRYRPRSLPGPEAPDPQPPARP